MVAVTVGDQDADPIPMGRHEKPCGQEHHRSDDDQKCRHLQHGERGTALHDADPIVRVREPQTRGLSPSRTDRGLAVKATKLAGSSATMGSRRGGTVDRESDAIKRLLGMGVVPPSSSRSIRFVLLIRKIHAPMQDAEDFDRILSDPVEDQVIAAEK